MWLWESELRELGFRRRSERYWRCDQRFNLSGIGHLSVFSWSEQTIPAGRTVRPLPEGDRYLAFLFARSPTPDAVEHALRTAAGRLEVVITPCASS